MLDNREHLRDAAPPLADLLAACPHLTLIRTSQAALRAHVERVYRVPPLGLPANRSDHTLA